MIPLIVVCGPTASGKTAMAIRAAKYCGGEIINADSMQIYKYMNIGTAKPTPEEMAEARHHLVDFVDPKKPFSVADYVPLAHQKIEEVVNRGHIPILSGGTGLYINSVVNDVEFGADGENPEIRRELNELAEKNGADYLIEMLRRFDPVTAEKMHPNNLRRIIRAIEFYKISGEPISEHQAKTKQKQSRYSPLMFMPDFKREILYERINKRVDIMLENGLIDEVKALADMGCTKDMQSMKGIGYKEVMEYLEGQISLEECSELIKLNSRRYAKRQLTWFRRDERIQLIPPEKDICENLKKFNKKQW